MSNQRILIVDNEIDVLFILEKELAARGYSIITADNGKEALRLAKSERPDLIILDVWMPDMSGMIVAAMLRADMETKDIPLVFLTCLLPKKSDEEQGHRILADLFIAKPYDIGELVIAIERLLCRKTMPVK